MKFTSITQRLVIWFLLISLLPILLIGFVLLNTFEQELRQTVTRQISAIADKKVNQIDDYLNGRVHDVLIKTQANSTRQSMNEFARVFALQGADSAAYRRLDANYREHYQRFIATTGYYDLFLISPQGTVVYSQTREADFTTNLFSGPYRNTGLAKVTRNALSTLESSISEFEPYAPSGNIAAAFVAVPIMIQDRLIGVLALQIDKDRVYQVILDGTGMGETGETVVARSLNPNTAMVLAPLKADPDAAMKHIIRLDDHSLATPLTKAMHGERGSGFEIDYMGQSVVAAWRYLPRMKWGMVVKMDTDEVLAPYYRVRNFALGVLLLALSVALLGAVLLGRKMILPLQKLTKNAQELAGGKLDQRIPVEGSDELGQLADSFNAMAENMQYSYQNLERLVAKRTGELTQSLDSLRTSESLLDSLIDNMPSMVFVKRASDLRFEKLNHAGEALLGYSEHDLLGKNDHDFFPREQADSFTKKDREILANHKLADIEHESIQTRNGETRILHTRKIGIYNAAGEPTHLLGVSIDITEQENAKEKLHISAERLNEAQRIAKVGSWELDLLSGELVWSDEIFHLFEIDKNKFQATYDAFLNAIHPADRERVNLAYTDSLKDRKPYEVKHRLLMGDGRIKWVQEMCESEFDADGKPLFSRGTVQDITQQELAENLLRESETRYHSVVAALTEGIVVNAKDGSIIAANEAAQKILGLSWEQMIGLTPIDPRWNAIHEDGTPFPGDMHPGSVTLRSGEPQSNVVMGVHKSDGSLTWILVNSQPIFRDDETLPSSVVASFVDISERKRTEEILKNSNEELERRVQHRTAMLMAAKEEAELANNSKSVFLSSMSHELRTPLNAILGYAQLMQMDDSLPQRVIENAGEIKHAGDILLSLMNDILDLSRIESGKIRMESTSVPISEVIASCQSQNIKAAESHNITLNLSDSLSNYHVTADRRGLMQVLNNLISNAIKYNRDGGRVNVTCSVVVPGKVRISVMDTGVGLSADKVSQLFQPFNRLGAEMSNIEGTGIGLVISRKLVEGMKGSIGVESVQGLGTTFWVEFPMATDVHSDNPVVFPRSAGLSAMKPRVLVAEDYAPNQNVLRLQLSTLGCEVEIAGDGVEALKMWNANTYDLILTDIDMPVMNGTEFAKAVRQAEVAKGGRIPIVAITATIENSELKRYQLAGIDEVLSKPLSMDMLRNGMKRWLGDIAATSAGSHALAKGKEATGDLAELATLDLNYLYRILGQVNLDQARRLLETFMRTADEGLHALNSQIDNPAVVAKEMHKQKSSAKTVGAMRYAHFAATLEQQTKDKNFTGIVTSLVALRQSLLEVEVASSNLFDSPPDHEVHEQVSKLVSVVCQSALVVDDDLVVLEQVKAMLDSLGVKEVITAVNGVEATKILFERAGRIEVLICDLSMPEMDGVELIRGFGETGFKGGLILISGADEKIISTVNKLAVLQGVRVLGQLQKPVSAEQLAILLAHTTDLPPQVRQFVAGPVVSSEAIRTAMATNEFTIWFQPKVDATTLRAVGMEALARWQLPSGKFIPPDSFISVAENEGLIGELSRQLVVTSLNEAAKLFKAGFPLKVSINLSGSWLNDLSLPDFILSNTTASGLTAADVILEVTETGVMEDLTTALDVLSRLRLKGFGLSIDDFGIGYSSFEQLGRIPFTEMKLDRSFVNKGVEDAAARAILESSMDMAHKLDLATVAEGVENELDLKLVRSLGCDLVQGYLIAKPMPVKDLIVWLNDPKNNSKQR